MTKKTRNAEREKNGANKRMHDNRPDLVEDETSFYVLDIIWTAFFDEYWFAKRFKKDFRVLDSV